MLKGTKEEEEIGAEDQGRGQQWKGGKDLCASLGSRNNLHSS